MQVRKIADESYTVALKHIRENREAIDYIVDELIEKETITGEVPNCKNPVCMSAICQVQSQAQPAAERPFPTRWYWRCRSSATSWASTLTSQRAIGRSSMPEMVA